jgi:hypothetical protein
MNDEDQQPWVGTSWIGFAIVVLWSLYALLFAALVGFAQLVANGARALGRLVTGWLA